jgi:hypothetical protein
MDREKNEKKEDGPLDLTGFRKPVRSKGQVSPIKNAS